MQKHFTPTKNEIEAALRVLELADVEPLDHTILQVTRQCSNGWNPEPTKITEFFYFKDVKHLI